MVIDSLWIAEFRRDQFADFLSGSVQLAPAGSSLPLPTPTGQLLAIWRSPNPEQHRPLPNIIIGPPGQIEDLYAWAATYLRGLGPISAHTRVISQDAAALLSAQRAPREWRSLAVAAVATILGEVQMLARRPLAARDITLPVCRSTLSFGLMRAAACGMPCSDLAALGEAWHRATSEVGAAAAPEARLAVVEISQCIVSPGDSSAPAPRSSVRWMYSSALEGDTKAVISELGRTFGRELLWWASSPSSKPAEEYVGMLDEIAPRIVRNANGQRLETAFAVAYLAFLCRPGFEEQASLIGPYVAEIPEAFVWLGALQAATRLEEGLVMGDGLGWRLAREVMEPLDIFSTPTCDINSSELTVLLRGRSSYKMVRSLSRARLDVELAPGISVLIRNPHYAEIESRDQQGQAQPALDLDESLRARPNNAGLTELLSEALRAERALSSFIKTAQEAVGLRPGGSQRKRK